MRLALLASTLALAISGATAAPHVSSALDAPSLSKRCINSATDRSCWGDFDTSTNYYDEVPDTGVTAEYWLEIVNTTAAFDGVERIVLTFNGTFPGPTIIANWGDTVVVHVTNSLTNNGTGIHFHGVRQNYTVQNDGVSSVTECPLAPGATKTYTWRATQYGHSWYHSHFSVQAWDGAAGGILINGPATANYDNDMGILFLSDWTHSTADALISKAASGGPPTADNGLINGTNVFGSVGSRFNMTFTPGESHRIRLVNTAINTHFKFMIDNHDITVIATDFVPIVPYSTQFVSIGIGQRYDIIVNASQTSGNFWLRALPQTSCSANSNTNDIKGIVKYDSTNSTAPTTSAYTFTESCADELISNLVPFVPLDAGIEDIEDTFAVAVARSGGVAKWTVAGSSFVSEWNDPTLLQVYNGATTFTAASNVVELDSPNNWVYFVIETTLGVTHPIHLHGHDFYLLGQGSGTFSSSTALGLVNPPRRDVAMLPGAGYLVIGFQTDNPGTWLLHCHIGWHTVEGLALQLVERRTEIAALIDIDTFNATCSAWDAYTAATGLVEDDSGI